MHEAAMAQGIVSTVLAEAARRGAHAVRAVDVQVGDLEGLDADALRAAFELEAVDTCAEGATLSIHVTPTRLVCTACGHAWEPRIHRDDPVACPRCAAPARVDGTRGIVIQRAILTTPDGP
ncbi:MAG TPA: hydrogenase maturation nickel metallochaperone HypA [Thermoplasmata archaeon]|nr:hydrogenase maturation nickel metallochaperone HypA [Thermoplasmata archaeon]